MAFFKKKTFCFSVFSEILQDDELLRGMREAAAAVICDEQHVFNAHAALARDVDARLVGDDHARLADGLIGLIEARPLVNLEAYAVAEAVTERVRVR